MGGEEFQADSTAGVKALRPETRKGTSHWGWDHAMWGWGGRARSHGQLWVENRKEGLPWRGQSFVTGRDTGCSQAGTPTHYYEGKLVGPQAAEWEQARALPGSPL